jgi:protein disulfide-isomerase
MRRTILLALAALSFSALAATGPYDEAANAKAQVTAAISNAAKTKVPVLVVFGANWCGDCRILDLAFKEGAAAPLIAKNFQVVKINVGRFDQNVAIAQEYGVPLKNGIPAVAVLSSKGEVLYATKVGELADARNMGDKGIYDFFVRVSGTAAK